MHPATNGVDQSKQNPQQQQWLQVQQAQQQQWMAMQYNPAAAMAMQQQMMYAQNYMAYQHQQNPPVSHRPQQSLTDDNKTVWIGDLQPWMDESYLHSCFVHTGEVTSVKLIRNKQTGQSDGYGFIEFASREAAEKVLQGYNGTAMPNVEQPFRLNWSTFNAGDRRSDASSDFSIFVGDLASDVTDNILQDTFSSVYTSVKGAKVVIDPNTGRPKGYGFVRFGEESEKLRAMTEMNGMYCLSRPMRISVATPKKQSGYQQQQQQYSSQASGDSINTTIFVGGLDSEVTDEDLRQPFSQFGDVVSVKIPVGKGCGFVQFAERKSAEEALQSLDGTSIGNLTIRLSWGRSPANRQQARTDCSNQWNGPYYGVGQGYNEYGALQAHDPSAYPESYANPQQQ